MCILLWQKESGIVWKFYLNIRSILCCIKSENRKKKFHGTKQLLWRFSQCRKKNLLSLWHEVVVQESLSSRQMTPNHVFVLLGHLLFHILFQPSKKKRSQHLQDIRGHVEWNRKYFTQMNFSTRSYLCNDLCLHQVCIYGWVAGVLTH